MLVSTLWSNRIHASKTSDYWLCFILLNYSLSLLLKNCNPLQSSLWKHRPKHSKHNGNCCTYDALWLFFLAYLLFFYLFLILISFFSLMLEYSFGFSDGVLQQCFLLTGLFFSPFISCSASVHSHLVLSFLFPNHFWFHLYSLQVFFSLINLCSLLAQWSFLFPLPSLTTVVCLCFLYFTLNVFITCFHSMFLHSLQKQERRINYKVNSY